MACSHTATCPLFPLISVNSALKVWKTFYCEGKFENCSRYTLSHSGKSVPANLLPNGRTLSTAGMASSVVKEKTEVAKAVEKAAPEIVEEMASIDLGEVDEVTIEVDTKIKADPAPAPQSSTASVADDNTRSWYLRILFNADTGVVGNVIQGLGGHRIKIDAMAEKRQSGGEVAMVLIVITDQTTEEVLNAAVSELQAMPTVVGPIKKIQLEFLSSEMFS